MSDALPTTTLGRTGLTVTRLGLGCGGPSRLGLKHDGTRDEAVNIIRRALDLGVSFLDTAEAYTTEPQVAQAVRESGRDDVVICTKTAMCDYPGRTNRSTGEQYRKQVEQRLIALDTDCLDILLIHGIDIGDEYDYCRSEIVPVLIDLRDEGKLRYFGFSEEFNQHTDHVALAQAAAYDDDCWDVVMMGFNILNQSARDVALRWTMKHNVGVLCMYAVRRTLSSGDRLQKVIERLVEEGQLDRDVLGDDPMAFLMREGYAESLTEAAYRFALAEDGLDVILSGTGNIAHLEANAAAVRRGPLSAAAVKLLRERFGHITGVSGN